MLGGPLEGGGRLVFLFRIAAQARDARLDLQLDRHQPLADAVMQVARQPRPLLLLRFDHALCQHFQLGVGHAQFAQVQHQAAGGHQQGTEDGDGGDQLHGRADIARLLGIDLGQRLVHVIHVNTGTHHPAPFRHQYHIAELGRGLVGRGFDPVVALETASAFGALHQALNGQVAVRVAQLPQILPHQLGLARMHQRLALQIVDEEIAIVAIAEGRQDALGFLLRGGILAARTIQRGDGMAGQGHVMLEFGLLAGQVGLLDGGALLLGQGNRLVPHGKRDGAQGEDERRDGQEDDFLSEFHGLARSGGVDAGGNT